jgi:hypothetical protein
VSIQTRYRSQRIITLIFILGQHNENRTVGADGALACDIIEAAGCA